MTTYMKALIRSTDEYNFFYLTKVRLGNFSWLEYKQTIMYVWECWNNHIFLYHYSYDDKFPA